MEKRVKSRFSHRQLLIPAIADENLFMQAVVEALTVVDRRLPEDAVRQFNDNVAVRLFGLP